MLSHLKHPLGKSIVILVLAYLLFDFGIPHIPPLIGVDSAPVPDSVLLEYMAVVVAAVLLWVSANGERWREFKEPIQKTLESPDREGLRALFLVVVPLAVGWGVYSQVRPSLAAPVGLRSIHPAPPSQIQFQDETIRITGLENPLREEGSLEEHYEEGVAIYYQNCLACHGDPLDGRGHFADGLNPVPANFQSSATIAQLTESFVFWRIAKGGPGLPPEGTPWNSAMPAWEDFLTEDEIWAVTIFLYEQTGWTPRTWEEAEGDLVEGETE
ncbi:MAG: c-type cytochrome [Longimicrobiales bacterium]